MRRSQAHSVNRRRTARRNQHRSLVCHPHFAQRMRSKLCPLPELANVGCQHIEWPVLRSVLVVAGQALVNPLPPIMASPDAAPDHAAIDRPPWNDDPPDMPNTSPRGQRRDIDIIFGIAPRVRSHLKTCYSIKRGRRAEYVRSAASPSPEGVHTRTKGNVRRCYCKVYAPTGNAVRELSLMSAREVKSGTRSNVAWLQQSVSKRVGNHGCDW